MQFGPYQLLARIGSGGVADVFRASRASRHGGERIYALKRMHRHFSDDPEWVDMFVTEAQITAELNHPNVVQVYEFGEIEGYYYLAMEYIEGHDLAWLTERFEALKLRIPIAIAVHIAAEVCGALSHAHTSRDFHGQPVGLVHRDISPANILVARTGEVKLVDFGIAKAKRRTEETTQGKIKGKFAYMSPEQINGEALDHRSDIFSFGIVLHEMLTGTGLFRSPSVVMTIDRIVNGTIHRPSRLNGKVPPELDEITLRALARDKEHRYQLTSELRDDLLHCAAEITGGATHVQVSEWSKGLASQPLPEADPGDQAASAVDQSTQIERISGEQALATVATPRPQAAALEPEPHLDDPLDEPGLETLPEFVINGGAARLGSVASPPGPSQHAPDGRQKFPPSGLGPNPSAPAPLETIKTPLAAALEAQPLPIYDHSATSQQSAFEEDYDAPTTIGGPDSDLLAAALREATKGGAAPGITTSERGSPRHEMGGDGSDDAPTGTYEPLRSRSVRGQHNAPTQRDQAESLRVEPSSSPVRVLEGQAPRGSKELRLAEHPPLSTTALAQDFEAGALPRPAAAQHPVVVPAASAALGHNPAQSHFESATQWPGTAPNAAHSSGPYYAPPIAEGVTKPAGVTKGLLVGIVLLSLVLVAGLISVVLLVI